MEPSPAGQERVEVQEGMDTKNGPENVVSDDDT